MGGRQVVAQVTGGRVAYSRTIQPAKYESKKAEVELNFVIAEGGDASKAADEVLALVKRKVLSILDLEPVKKGAAR